MVLYCILWYLVTNGWTLCFKKHYCVFHLLLMIQDTIPVNCQVRVLLITTVQTLMINFQYASPHLWNQLPFSLHEPVSPPYAYLNPSFSSPLSPSITPSLFHSKLKTYLFGKSFHHRSLTIDTSDWLPRLMGPFSVFTVFVSVISCFCCGRQN